MTISPTYLVCGAGIVVIASIVIEIVGGRFRPTARGIGSMGIGGVLLVVGMVLHLAGMHPAVRSLPVVDTAWGRKTVRETSLFGGTLLLVCGTIWRLGGSGGRQEHRGLKGRLAEKRREVASVQEVLNGIVRSSVSGVMILHAIREGRAVVDFECHFMNDEAEQVLGRSAADLLGKPLLAHLPCLKDEGLFDEAVGVLDRGRPFRDERVHEDDQRQMWYQISLVKQGDGIIATFTDVSSRKQTEQKLQHVSKHDLLTGLPSRAVFSDRLAQAITREQRFPHYKYAVLLMDVDRFKVVNDSLGHEVGDQLLLSVSERIRVNLRKLDTATRMAEDHLQARLGGDEFVVLLDGIQEARDASMVAERIQEALAAPHIIEGHEITSTASIGIVVSCGNYQQPDEILRDADIAMHQAKEAGKARHVIFDERMHSQVMERLHLEKELRQAAAQLEFTLHYQPIVSLETAALKGFEALIRWHHPQRGLVPPGQFIGLAEELGLIIPIGHWALREACRQLRRWQTGRGGHPPLSMSVNLSKLQLTHDDLVASVTGVIDETGVEAGSLILEVTESMIMDNTERIFPVLAQLRQLGVRLAMDDFGTGHSSLSFLHRVPMDILKIDRSFINRTDNARQHGSIIHTIIQLAKILDMQVVAEGIETTDQLVLLQSLDCNYGQGYLFAKPLEPPAAEKLVGREHRFRVKAA